MKREKAKEFQDLLVWQKAHKLEEINNFLEDIFQSNSGFWLLTPDFFIEYLRYPMNYYKKQYSCPLP